MKGISYTLNGNGKQGSLLMFMYLGGIYKMD